MEKKILLMFCIAMVFLMSSTFAGTPGRGTCQIVENTLGIDAYCDGATLVIREEANTFNVLEAPTGIDIDVFSKAQTESNLNESKNDDQFVVAFFSEDGQYQLEINGKELTVEFKQAENTPEFFNSLTTALLAIALVALSAGLLIFRKRIKFNLLIAVLIIWIVIFALLIIQINPL